MQVRRLEDLPSATSCSSAARAASCSPAGRPCSCPMPGASWPLMQETVAASLRAPPLERACLRIGIPEEYGQSILPRALGLAFSKRHPPTSTSPSTNRMLGRASRQGAGRASSTLRSSSSGKPFGGRDPDGRSDGLGDVGNRTACTRRRRCRSLSTSIRAGAAISPSARWNSAAVVHRIAYWSDTIGGLHTRRLVRSRRGAALAHPHPGRLPRTHGGRWLRRHRLLPCRPVSSSRRHRRGAGRHGTRDPRGLRHAHAGDL